MSLLLLFNEAGPPPTATVVWVCTSPGVWANPIATWICTSPGVWVQATQAYVNVAGVWQ